LTTSVNRAIVATLLYHGMRREELCRLPVRDIQDRQGVKRFRVKGTRDKVRFIPVHAAAQRIIEEYLANRWTCWTTAPARVSSGDQ
jgi:integrase/recombinase XerD